MFKMVDFCTGYKSMVGAQRSFNIEKKWIFFLPNILSNALML